MLNNISHRLPPYRGVVNFIWAQLYTAVNSFGSWPIQVEGEMQLILVPEGVEVYIQTIASNESVHMIYTQMFILLSQGRERDAWGGFDCF